MKPFNSYAINCNLSCYDILSTTLNCLIKQYEKM